MSKKVIIIAGPNGAGKTTLANEYFEVFNYSYVSADAIAATLAPREVDKVRVQAGRDFFNQMKNLIAEGQNLIVESTLSGVGFERMLHRLRKAHYTITISFIYLETPEICIKRVKERVLKGGHPVPERDIKRRFYRSKKNFWHIYKNQVDYWHLFYNANQSFLEVATGQGIDLTVTDEGLLKRFLHEI